MVWKIVLWGLIILLLVLLIRQRFNRNKPSSENKLSNTQRKVVATTGKTALIGSALGGSYLIYLKLGIIAVGVIAVIGVIIFFVIKMKSGSGGGLLSGLNFGSGSSTNERLLKRLDNKFNWYTNLGWDVRWANPDHSVLRVHKGDKTLIWLIRDGKLVSYDPMETFDFDPESTTGLLGGYDYTDLTKDYDEETGVTTYTNPDGDIVLQYTGGGAVSEQDDFATYHQLN